MRAHNRIVELPDGLPRTELALSYAERCHAGQRRRVDGAPFMAHVVEVALLLCNVGAPDDVVAAGLLHDVLEKTDARATTLRRRFGARVTAIVLALTEDDMIAGYWERKAALRARVATVGGDALLVFAADKISKVRELQFERRQPAPRAGDEDNAARVEHYRACVEMLEAHAPDLPLVGRLRAEFDAVVCREHALAGVG